jgi:flagellar hook-associated protein 1 FlgK
VSINSATYIALSGMMATQVQLEVASANISNADTAGYTDKTAQQVAVVNAGVGAGTTISGIGSTIDKALLKSLIDSVSALDASDTTNNYLNNLQALYGATTGSNGTGTSIANTLASLESALSSLSSNPSDATAKASVVSALDTTLTQLRSISAGIQNQRSNADKDIDADVDAVNKQLKLIGSLNIQIQQAKAAGQPTGDLEDQRNTALQSVASQMNVQYFTTSGGSLQVYTASGQALVDTTVHTLSYTPASTVTSSTTYIPGGSGGFGGITVNGIDVTAQIASGNIGALIDLRDDTLPDAQAQLDQLATQLQTAVNGAANQGTPSPAPASLTGTATVTSSTALSGTGTFRIALVDSSGNLSSYQDFNLSSYATVGDLMTAIDGVAGLSASINGDGNLTITSTNASYGVAVNEMTSAVNPSGEGLSAWLGLNDVVTGSSASDIAVRSGVLDNASLLPASSLDSSSTLTAGANVLPPGSAAVANDLYDALTGSTSFSAIGGLAAVSASFAEYAANIVSDVASKASTASTDYTNKQATQSFYSSALSSQTGVNIDQETSRISTLQNQYEASAQVLATIKQMFSLLMTVMSTT